MPTAPVRSAMAIGSHGTGSGGTVGDVRTGRRIASAKLFSQLRQTATKTKELFRARPIGQCGRRRRCLHGLCHGSQWPWLTSPVLSASPAVARARRALNHLHLLVTSGSANNSVCFLRVHSSSWPCPRYSKAIPARSSSMSVPGLPQFRKGTPRASCGRKKGCSPYGS